jgi:hypothetical protein
MPRPYCVRCQCEMHPDKNGVVLEIYGALWHADLWKCPVCGTEIIAGYGFAPVAYNYQANYGEIKSFGAQNGLYSCPTVEVVNG